MKKTVVIHTDGACSKNPGKGGYAAILQYKAEKKTISGGVAETTTNQRMEIMAALESLKALNQPCNVLLHTDSMLVVNGITKWMKDWEANNWTKSNGKQPAHLDLWQQISSLTKIHDVKAIHVRAHSTNKMNNLVDKIASESIPA